MKPVKIEFLMVDRLSEGLDRSVDKIGQLSGKADIANTRIQELDRSGLSLKNTISRLATAFTLKELVSNVTRGRGEIQQLEVAFTTMLGSAVKSRALMSELTRTAAVTPFRLDDVATGAKQLLAYGVAAEEVNDTLMRLGDISAGLSIPLGDLVYLYGTTMVQGRLFTKDLNQFTGRGIPLTRELAEVMGVAEGKVAGLVESGKVGFSEVRKAIENLTNEGGKFGGLMTEQSKTILGQISNLEDNFARMFNEIGTQSEGAIYTAIDGANWLVDHYAQVGTALMTLVSSYGVYKATLMATTAYTNAAYSYEITQLQALLGVKSGNIDADLAEAVSKRRLTASRAEEVQALRAELAAKLENLKAEAVVAASDAREATRKRMLAQLAYDKAHAEVMAKQEEIFAMEGMYAHQTAETLQKEKDTLVTKMHAAQEELDAAAKLENAAKTRAASAAQAVNTTMTQKDTLAKKLNTTHTKLLTIATGGLRKALNALKAAFATNPFGLILMGATMLIGTLLTLDSAMGGTTAEVERFGEAAAKQYHNVDTLIGVINSTSSTSKVHKDAMDELCKIYDEYGIKIDEEKDKLAQLNEMREEVVRLIQEEGEERQKANSIASYDEALNSATTKMRDDLKSRLEEAELDGTGTFDDWDADEVRERADELAIIIASIYESEADAIAKITDDAARDKKMGEIQSRAAEQLARILGFENDEAGRVAASFYMAKLDVDFTEVLEEYIDKTSTLITAKQDLVDSFRSEAAAGKEVQQVTYDSSMSLEELYDAAYAAAGAVDEVGKSSGKPEVDRSSIDLAIASASLLLDKMNSLFGTSWSVPDIDFTKIPGYKEVTNFFGGIYKTNQDKQSIAAQYALEQKFTEAVKTRKGTADLLKEVDQLLETALAGSDDESRLLGYRHRLQAQQNKFSPTNNNKNKADRELKEAERRKDLREKLGKELVSLQKENEKAEIDADKEGLQKKLNQIEYDYKARKKEIEELSEKWKRDNRSAGLPGSLTEEQENAIEKANKVNDRKRLQERQKATAEAYQDELDAMHEYLRAYGTLQQQKSAIAEEYAGKIGKAVTTGERLALEAERDRLLEGINTAELQQSWRGVFDGIDSMSIEALGSIKERLQDALSGKDITPEIGEQLDKINELILKRKVGWTNLVGGAIGDVANRMAEIRQAEEDNTAAQNKLNQAVEEEKKARQRVLDIQHEIADLAKKHGIDISAGSVTSGQAPDLMSKITGKDGNLLAGLFSKLGKSERGAAQATERLGTASEEAAKAVGTLKGAGGGAAGTIAMVDTIIHGVNDNIQSSIGLLKELGIEESDFGKGMSKFAESSEYATKAWESLKSGNVMGVAEGVLGSLRTLGEVLGEWGLGGFGKSDKNLQKDLERLALSNEVLKNAIDNLAEKMEDTAVADATSLYEQQKSYLNDSIRNMQESMRRSGAAYSNGFMGIGGNHSSNYEINRGMSAAEWARVSKVTGASVRSAADFWNLTGEQMAKLATDAPDLYAKIKDLADNGHENAAQYMDEYIEYYRQLEELEDAWREKLTATSFDSVRDEFKTALMDMDTDAEDFAESFSDMMRDAMVESMLTEKYDGLLKEWYKAFAEDMKDGSLDDASGLRDWWDRIVSAARKEMEDINEATDYNETASVSQSGKTGGFSAMTQDQGTKLEGMFTSGLQHWSSMDEKMENVSEKMNSAENHLAKIEENTGKSAGHLGEIKEEIRKILRDGLKVK